MAEVQLKLQARKTLLWWPWVVLMMFGVLMGLRERHLLKMTAWAMPALYRIRVGP